MAGRRPNFLVGLRVQEVIQPALFSLIQAIPRFTKLSDLSWSGFFAIHTVLRSSRNL